MNFMEKPRSTLIAALAMKKLIMLLDMLYVMVYIVIANSAKN
jgi:hypothetical protein